MRILVTGSGGFIGKYLVKKLAQEGHDVVEHQRIDGDLTRKDSLNKYEAIDAVYHLAARTVVSESWNKPFDYIGDNTSMLTNVLELCRRCSSRMIYLSTYLYGEPQYLPIDEKHRRVAITPYHLSKEIGEDICSFYNSNYGIKVAIVRPFNVYGYGQSEDFLLPKVYNQVADDSVGVVEVFSLTPKRDYVYVEDLVEALARILPHVEGYNVYNVGSGKSYSVKEVIDLLQEEFKTEKPVYEKKLTRKNEIMDCVADIDHLEEKIGSFSVTPLKDGIHKWHVLSELKGK